MKARQDPAAKALAVFVSSSERLSPLSIGCPGGCGSTNSRNPGALLVTIRPQEFNTGSAQSGNFRPSAAPQFQSGKDLSRINHQHRKDMTMKSCMQTLAAALTAMGLAATIATADTVNAVYYSATDVPVTTNSYTASGNTVYFALNFVPPTGADLMVVKCTNLTFINGTFDNLTNGQPVALSYGGVVYNFVANYYGGSGNDLVLAWANNRAYAWGRNIYWQLGCGTTSTTNHLQPVPVATTCPGGNTALSGKTVLAVAGGLGHSLALCSDGSVAAWGLYNTEGELGNNDPHHNGSYFPVAVNTDSGISALYGKRVVAIAVGQLHSLALCSDGTVVAWGYNSDGELGDNTQINRYVPVAVNTNAGVSALYGKTVIAIAAGEAHSLALCSDGTVVAWGYNASGQLGDNTQTNRYVPVAVNRAPGVSALYGKTVVALAAGMFHSVALCSNGMVAAWGEGGLLGDNTQTSHSVPVAVVTNSGFSALYGKTVVAIASGILHTMALCSDGTVATWGENDYGQLGNNTTTTHNAPVAVSTVTGLSVLSNKTVVAITSGDYHSVALCSDGSVADWGYNYDGELGDNSTTNRLAPVAVTTIPLVAGQSFSRVGMGRMAAHTLAVVAEPPVTGITLTSATNLADRSFRLSFASSPGATFSVLATTNLALPLSNWMVLTGAVEISPGQYQLTDPQATNKPQRLYRVRWP